MSMKKKAVALICTLCAAASLATPALAAEATQTTEAEASASAVEMQATENTIVNPSAAKIAEVQNGENTHIMVSSKEKVQKYSTLLEEPKISLNSSMQYVDTLSIGLERFGTVYHCTGVVDLIGNRNVATTMSLQRRSATSSSWSNVYTWKKSFSGSNCYVLEGDYAVSSGYYYRTYFRVDVKNSSGGIIETASGYSGTELY